MISVTANMIFRSVIYALLLGILSGVLYSLIRGITVLLRSIKIRKAKEKVHKSRSLVLNHVFEFFFAVSIGVVYILLLYAFTDGTFYFCSLYALLIGFLSAYRISALALKLK